MLLLLESSHHAGNILYKILQWFPRSLVGPIALPFHEYFLMLHLAHSAVYEFTDIMLLVGMMPWAWQFLVLVGGRNPPPLPPRPCRPAPPCDTAKPCVTPTSAAQLPARNDQHYTSTPHTFIYPSSFSFFRTVATPPPESSVRHLNKANGVSKPFDRRQSSRRLEEHRLHGKDTLAKWKPT